VIVDDGIAVGVRATTKVEGTMVGGRYSSIRTSSTTPLGRVILVITIVFGSYKVMAGCGFGAEVFEYTGAV